MLDEVSIAYAKELIKHSQKPIAEIAQILGFSSSANFARTFKRITGKTPSMLRLPPQKSLEYVMTKDRRCTAHLNAR
ncbi:helix-turn-helix domain-containing protein [Acinetobacter sp. V102_4]|nr:helix-turn-helix domain-containing protein [Acinetobacter sp. V102_4]MDS7927932.1 helix-turn-helix domain-containing protein [Acinetobacter sp. V102_4]